MLGEPRGEDMHAALGGADHVVTSELTLVECDRALIRAETLQALPPAETGERRIALQTTAAHWTLLSLCAAIIERARRPFPLEPIRTLDALHLSSALSVATTVDELTVLSLDRRIRASGLGVLPAA